MSGIGVRGEANSSNARGVYGSATGTGGKGVYGRAAGGAVAGVYGYTNNAAGFGLLAESAAPFGTALSVCAMEPGGVGIEAFGGPDSLNISALLHGWVFTVGRNLSRNVVLGWDPAFPEATSSGYVGVYDSSDYEVAYMTAWGEKGGVVSADLHFGDSYYSRIPDPENKDSEFWYACPQGPEAAAYVRGTAELVNGKAEIKLPGHFAAVAAQTGLTVQVTPLSAESRGLAVVEKSTERIVVQELGGGNGSYEFDYLVTGVRRGMEDHQVSRPVSRRP